MDNVIFYFLKIYLIFNCLFICNKIYGQKIDEISSEFQAVFFAKTLSFYTNSSPQVNVLVIGNDNDFVNEIKKIMNKSKIKDIKIDTKLPAISPDIIFLTDSSKLDDVLKYTEQKKILSATSDPSLVKKGINLSIGSVDGKPRVIINKTRAEKENVRWNPALLNNPLTLEIVTNLS